jgi:hypothetical protein
MSVDEVHHERVRRSWRRLSLGERLIGSKTYFLRPWHIWAEDTLQFHPNRIHRYRGLVRELAQGAQEAKEVF